MLGGIAIIPSAPLLVPELAGAAAAEVAELRAAVLDAAAALPPRWLVVGGGAAAAVIGPDSVGTFAGFGAEVTVRLSPTTQATPAPLPLCALIAGWVRGAARPDARAEVRVFADDPDTAAALAAGRVLRAEIDRATDPIGVLVVADGANTLTASAPGGYRRADIDVQDAVDDALGRGDTAALRRPASLLVGRTALAVLAGLAQPPPRSAKELYRGAPYGVGYFVGIWQP